MCIRDSLGVHGIERPISDYDAVAGRIRRLLATADKVAQELGVPDTESALPADLREDG